MAKILIFLLAFISFEINRIASPIIKIVNDLRPHPANEIADFTGEKFLFPNIFDFYNDDGVDEDQISVGYKFPLSLVDKNATYVEPNLGYGHGWDSFANQVSVEFLQNGGFRKYHPPVSKMTYTLEYLPWLNYIGSDKSFDYFEGLHNSIINCTRHNLGLIESCWTMYPYDSHVIVEFTIDRKQLNSYPALLSKV